MTICNRSDPVLCRLGQIAGTCRLILHDPSCPRIWIEPASMPVEKIRSWLIARSRIPKDHVSGPKQSNRQVSSTGRDSNNHAIAYAFVLIQKLMKVGSRVLFVRLVTKNAYLQVLIGWKSRRREPISNDRQSVPKTCAKNRCPASPAPVSVHTFRAAE